MPAQTLSCPRTASTPWSSGHPSLWGSVSWSPDNLLYWEESLPRDTLRDTEEEFWVIVQDLLWNLWWFKIDRQLNTSILLSHSLSSTDQEEKIWWKESSWFAKERSLTNYQSHHCENRLSVREINIIHCLLID